jgi:hypothetical protein
MKTKSFEAKNHKTKLRPTRKIINVVIRLEQRVWKAAQDRDAKTFRELVPADAIMIFQSGIVPQPEYLATMNERIISRYELGHISGFMPNATTVILYYKALRLGEEAGRTFPPGAVLESTTWIKRGGRWVAILNQETPAAGEGHQTSSPSNINQ